MKKKEEKSSVVKIDPYLARQIEQIIVQEEYRFKFANKKQFIDLAVNDLLNKLKEEQK